MNLRLLLILAYATEHKTQAFLATSLAGRNQPRVLPYRQGLGLSHRFELQHQPGKPRHTAGQMSAAAETVSGGWH